MTHTPNGPGSLSGKRIVVTRAANQAAQLDDLLRSRGGEPLSYPCIAIAPPADTGPLDAALSDLAVGEFDWLVLTSRNTVLVLAERLEALGLSLPERPRLSVAAVGTATAEVAERKLGLYANLVPAQFVAEALAATLLKRTRPGSRVLLCQADVARHVLAAELTAAGIAVTAAVAYRTVIGSGGINLPVMLAARQVDAITLTSSSTVRNLLQRLYAEGGRVVYLAGVCLACLGPITARTTEKLGLTANVVAQEHTIPALVDALEAHFTKEKR